MTFVVKRRSSYKKYMLSFNKRFILCCNVIIELSHEMLLFDDNYRAAIIAFSKLLYFQSISCFWVIEEYILYWMTCRNKYQLAQPQLNMQCLYDSLNHKQQAFLCRY